MEALNRLQQSGALGGDYAPSIVFMRVGEHATPDDHAHLSDRGKEQVMASGLKLQLTHLPVGHIITSPLPRALETGCIVEQIFQSRPFFHSDYHLIIPAPKEALGALFPAALRCGVLVIAHKETLPLLFRLFCEKEDPFKTPAQCCACRYSPRTSWDAIMRGVRSGHPPRATVERIYPD